MTKVADDDTAAAAPAANADAGEAWSFLDLERRLFVVRSGIQVLRDLCEGQAIREGTREGIDWMTGEMMDAEQSLTDDFTKLLDRLRHEREAHRRELAELRAQKAAPGSAEQAAAVASHARVLAALARQALETAGEAA